MIAAFPYLAIAVAAIIAYFLPLASSFVVKRHWPAEVAGILTALFSALDGFGTEVAHAGLSDDVSFSWHRAASTALMAFLVAVLARSNTWRGSRTDEKALNVGSRNAPAAPSA